MSALFNNMGFQPLRWENPCRKRYYQIFLSRDLLGDWVVTKSWGGSGTSTGRVSNVACASLEDAEALIEKIANTRAKRGYLLQP